MAARPLLLFILLLVSGKITCQEAGFHAETPKNMTPHQFNRRIRTAGKPLLVCFTAERCSICRWQEIILDEIRQECRAEVEFIYLDLTENPKISRRFEVDRLPVLILYINDYLAWLHVGFVEKQKIMELLYLLIP